METINNIQEQDVQIKNDLTTVTLPKDLHRRVKILSAERDEEVRKTYTRLLEFALIRTSDIYSNNNQPAA